MQVSSFEWSHPGHHFQLAPDWALWVHEPEHLVLCPLHVVIVACIITVLYPAATSCCDVRASVVHCSGASVLSWHATQLLHMRTAVSVHLQHGSCFSMFRCGHHVHAALVNVVALFIGMQCLTQHIDRVLLLAIWKGIDGGLFG